MLEENLNKQQKVQENGKIRKNTAKPRTTRSTKKSQNIVNVKQETIEEKTRIAKRPYHKKNEKQNNRNNEKENTIFKKSRLKIIPLGGLHEVGKNITVFEYENEIIVVDCGLSFPEDDMLGVDLVIPDITYLEKNVDKIKGL